MSLYPQKSLIQSSEPIQTVDALIAELEKFKTSGTNFIDLTVSWEDTHTRVNDACVTLELIEKTLSDGSVIHDIQMNFSEVEI